MIKRSAIGGVDRGRYLSFGILIDRTPVCLDRVDAVRLWSNAFLGDRSIEGGKIDHMHRLCAQHEWIVAKAMGIDFHRGRSRANVVEALGRIGFDPAVEQMRGDEIA